MVDPAALLAEHPSVFEAGLRGWLARRARRFSLDVVSADPTEPRLVDFEPHGRGDAGLGMRWADDHVPASVDSFAGLLERGASQLAAAKAAHVRQGQEAAEVARALAAFAAVRPAAVLDRPDGEVGAAAAASRAARPAVLTKVSEWAVDEVMVALALSSGPAARLLEESVTVVEQLPATLTALEAGTISWAHAQMLVEVLAPMSDAEKRAEVEARLLARAAGRTVAQLRASARRAVLRADASAATRRLAAAIRDRQVRVFPGKDGMASWVATMTAPVALACHNALRQYAESCKVPGDERTLDQRMVDCLVDLILRPGESGLPPVQAQLTVVAGVDTMRGGDEPGEVDGHPLPATLVRELAYALGLLPRPEPPAAEPPTADPPAAETPAATGLASDEPVPEAAVGPPADADTDAPKLPADEAAADRIADLLGLTTVAGTALTHLPAIAVTDELSGQLLALTTAMGIRAAATCSRRACRTGRRPCTHRPDGPGLGPPPVTPGYRPSDPLGQFLRARDRRCRFPGCRAPAIRCDLDHNTPWPAGATSSDNLCCLCRHHHRLSHQAPGWRMRRRPDGGLEWTTPGGDRITTHPPRYGTDDPGPPGNHATPNTGSKRPPDPPRTLRELVLGRPHPPGYVDDDPPPF